MTRLNLTRTASTLGAAALLLAGSTATATPATPDTLATSAGPDLTGLHVLLVNDDSAQGKETHYGTDGQGLYEMRRALCDAGADVVVVAPWSQQSGAGAKVTTPGHAPVPMSVATVTPPAAYAGDCGDAPSGGPVHGVCVADGGCADASPSASPSDAVLLGLGRVVPDHYWADGPDVVVSGVNFGQNVGELVNHSGTVGAAITAREQGVAAMAISAEVSFEDLTATPLRQAAEFAVDALARLTDADLMTPETALNVNHPFIGAGEELGDPVLTRVGTATDIGFEYTGDAGVDGGTYELVVGPPTEESRRSADTSALRSNDIPVTPLDGDWTGDGARYQGLLRSWR